MVQSNLTEKELRDMRDIIDLIIAFIVDDLSIFLSDVVGKDLRGEFKISESDIDTEELSKQIEGVFEVMKEIKDISESDQIPHEEKISRSYHLLEKLVRIAIPEIPQDASVLDFLSEQFKPKAPLKYMRNTKYLEYISAVEKLLQEIEEKGKIELVDNFLKEFNKSDDAFIIAQATIDPLPSYHDYLQREHKHIENQQIRKYIDIYSELSGHYEKLLSIIVGLLCILRNGEKPNYGGIRNKNLYKNLEKIGREKNLRILTEGFDRNIRNAIAHGNNKPIISDKKIDFIDRNTTVSLSYYEFIDLVKETSSLIFALLQIQNIVAYHRFVAYKNLVMSSIGEV